MMVAWLLALSGAVPLSAQDPTAKAAPIIVVPGAVPETWGAVPEKPLAVEEIPWQTAWGILGLRVIPAGPKIAPNGGEYHPNFSLDLNFNIWLWRSQGLYLFADMRLWGERNEYQVTNSRDGWLGTSKREFDLSGGAAWNYFGSWEARAFGYTNNNLNRGDSQVNPSGFTDGFGLENRYYLSPEYARLGQTGFDVARATFVSVGYYPSKEMVGNDGQTFNPGMLLRAYLIQDLWDWPCYAYGDTSYISDRSFHARLLLFDLGLAVRPFHTHQQWEFRLGSENTADVQVRDVFTLWYGSLRFIY
jgi:hypothetical protein